MKITKTVLKRIIKEELRKEGLEASNWASEFEEQLLNITDRMADIPTDQLEEFIAGLHDDHVHPALKLLAMYELNRQDD